MRRNHSYVVMSSPDMAERFTTKGALFNEERFEVHSNPDSPAVDLIGVTRRAIVTMSEEADFDAVMKEVERSASVAPTSIFRLSKNPRIVFVDFESPDSVVRLVATGLEGETQVDYAEERARAGAAEGGAERERRPRDSDRDGSSETSSTVSIVGIPAGSDAKEVSEIVFKATGEHPVKVNLHTNDRGTTVAFVEMATPAKAKKVGASQLPEGVMSRIVVEKRPDETAELVGKTSRVFLGNVRDEASGKRALDAIIAKIGEQPTEVADRGSYLRFTVSSPEVAARLYEEGVVLDNESLRIRLIKAEEPVEPSESVHLGGLARDATEEDVISRIRELAGVTVRRLALIQDTVRGGNRGFGYATFASKEDAQKVVSLGVMEMGGRRVVGRFVKPEVRSSSPRSGVSNVTARVVVAGSSKSAEELSKAVEQITGVAPSASSVEGSSTVFSLPLDAARKVEEQGLTVDGEKQNVQLEVPPQNPELAGVSRAIYVARISPNVDQDELSTAVFNATGLRPTLVAQPPNKEFAFIHFKSGADAQVVATKGFTFEGKRPALGYARDRTDTVDGDRRSGGSSRGGGFSSGGRGGERSGGGYRNDREGGERSGGYRGSREGGDRNGGGYRGSREGGERSGGYRGDRNGGERGDRSGGDRGGYQRRSYD